MIDILIEVIAAFILVVGTICGLYGLYSLTVRGFSGAVRLFCFIVCGGCYVLGIWIMIGLNSQVSELQQRYSGNYWATSNERKYLLRLHPDGTFHADTALFPEATGEWSVYTEDATIITLTKDERQLNWYKAEPTVKGWDLVPQDGSREGSFRLKKESRPD